MKKSQLKKLIKEEVSKTLKEDMEAEKGELTKYLKNSIDYIRTTGDDFGSIVYYIKGGLKKYERYL